MPPLGVRIELLDHSRGNTLHCKVNGSRMPALPKHVKEKETAGIDGPAFDPGLKSLTTGEHLAPSDRHG
jgi:hypothetical protein